MKQLKARVTAIAMATAALLGGVGTLGAGQADAATRATSPCPTNIGRVACVDLTHQKLWIQDGRKVIYGPVTVRTGRKGYATRPGLFHIYWRDRYHVSSIYHVYMPYAEFFDKGQALHAVGIPMSTPPGSHGCVNMTMHDAAAVWNLLRVGNAVDVFGRKPGT
ncbi:lipoprotein-anchoring transpeptidase ErfK/SrfK [Streptacidiphilus sp. MAP12-20]